MRMPTHKRSESAFEVLSRRLETKACGQGEFICFLLTEVQERVLTKCRLRARDKIIKTVLILVVTLSDSICSMICLVRLMKCRQRHYLVKAEVRLLASSRAA